MLDPRAAEAARIETAAVGAGLAVRYVELPDAMHHYTVVYRSEVLAQRLTASEASAFIEGYRMGRASWTRGGSE